MTVSLRRSLLCWIPLSKLNAKLHVSNISYKSACRPSRRLQSCLFCLPIGSQLSSPGSRHAREVIRRSEDLVWFFFASSFGDTHLIRSLDRLQRTGDRR